jgi:nucleotide-binding universal stress UspA family protein
MTKQILVGLEGSDSGKTAIEVAIELAALLRGTLVGLAIVDEPEIRSAQATPIGGSSYKAERDDALVAQAQQHARAWCDAFTARCAEAGVPARTLEVHGDAAETLLEESRLRDLLVLGRDANFHFETEENDAKTREVVLHKAASPVLIVPAERVATGPGVLVAYDGTQAAIRAVRAFAASGLAADRPVHVLSVGDSGERTWAMAAQGCTLLDELGIIATPHHVVSVQTTTETLLDQREKLDCGLVVQGAYAHSRFARLLWGSVTKEMLEKTKVPMFLHY